MAKGEQRRERWGGRSGRGRTGVTRLSVLVVALISALLVTTSTAGSQSGPTPVYAPAGTLDLFASAAGGDGVDFTPTAGSSATATELFGSDNKSQLSENGPDDLVVLTPTGPSGGQLPYVGLKDQEIGVRSKGEGSGTPASRTDGDETLTIALGPDVPGDYAWFAQVAVSAKFDADILIEGIDETGAVVAADTYLCSASDCGPDSGGDRALLTVGAGTSATLFTELRISLLNDGAASIIDDPSAGFDTYLEIVEAYDGEIECDLPEGNINGDVAYLFTRIGALDEDCGVIKPYDEAIIIGGPDEIQFEPDSSIQSVYRGDLTFPAGTGAAFFDPLTYDIDLAGPLEDMLPCDPFEVAAPRAGTSVADATALADVFSEMGDLVPSLYPELPADEASCVVAFDTTAGGLEHWVVRLDFDPRYR